MLSLDNNSINTLVVTGFMFIQYFPMIFRLEMFNTKSIMSFAAGVGISYVMVHLFPQLSYFQGVLNNQFGWTSGILSTHAIYIIVFIGFISSYISHKLDEDNFKKIAESNPIEAETIHFWTEVSFFIAYNIMIGYLAISKHFDGISEIIVYFSAFSLHFLMNDWGINHHHHEMHKKIGRKVLTISLLVGGGIALLFDLPYFIVVSFEAFIAGALILNVIKFELPNDDQSNIRCLLLGAVLSLMLFVFV